MTNFMYSAPMYFAVFLPAVILLYQICPQKFRKFVLILANYAFFFIWSKFFLVYQVITMFITYLSAKIIDRTTNKKIKKISLIIAILINLGVLVVLKYTNFFGENIFAIFHQAFTPVHLIAPIGISYYTLQMISYLMDTSSGKIHTDHSIVDICLGSAEIFGIKLPENFRQPFFAENASDFWRRWHITLGTFLRDYVFYPISLAKTTRRLSKFFTKHFGKAAGKFIGPLIALFAVWFLNGLWHGPYCSYIFYGLYYFCFMVLEILLKKPSRRFLKETAD